MTIAKEVFAGAKGSLVTYVRAGLGNRLSALLSAMVVAETLECGLTIIWSNRDNDCFQEFFALFGPAGLEGVVFKADELEKNWLDARKISGAEIKRRIEQGEEVRLVASAIFGFDLREGWKFFEAVREKLRRLQPVAEVAALINSVPLAPIGVHIRFTDHFPCHAFTPRWCYRSALKLLGERFPGIEVFVCSDTPRFVTELRNNTAVKVITVPLDKTPANASRKSLEASRAALADLWLLSRAPVLLSAPLSSFATIAQNLGGGLAYFLSRVADTTKFRRTQIAWLIYDHISLDSERQNWTVRNQESKNIFQISVSFLFVWWTKFVCSRLYQDYPAPFTRRRFEKRFNEFLRSPDCERALAGRMPRV